MFAAGSSEVQRHLAFRDFSTAHAEIAVKYSDLKKSLAAAFPDSIEKYMDGKDAFIKEVDRIAAEWRAGSSVFRWRHAEESSAPAG